VGGDDISDQLAAVRAGVLASSGRRFFGARHEQDHLHVQQRGAAERILPAAIHGPERLEEVGQVLVPGQQVEVAPDDCST